MSQADELQRILTQLQEQFRLDRPPHWIFEAERVIGLKGREIVLIGPQLPQEVWLQLINARDWQEYPDGAAWQATGSSGERLLWLLDAPPPPQLWERFVAAGTDCLVVHLPAGADQGHVHAWDDALAAEHWRTLATEPAPGGGAFWRIVTPHRDAILTAPSGRLPPIIRSPLGATKALVMLIGGSVLYRPCTCSAAEVLAGPDMNPQNARDRKRLLIEPGPQALGPILQRLDSSPDLLLAKPDATHRLWPTAVADFPGPRFLLLGDTHHQQTPLQSMLGYALDEPWDWIVSEHDRHHLHWFVEIGFPRVHWLPAFNLNAYAVPQPPPEERLAAVAFIGQVGPHHPRRQRLIEALRAAQFPMHVKLLPQTMAAEMYAIHRISLNISLNGDLNLRVFEVIAAGGFLLTDRLAPQSGIDLLFHEGEHYVAYDDEADLKTKIRYYLEHPEEASRIAASGREHFWENHAPAIRQGQLEQLLQGGALDEQYHLGADRRGYVWKAGELREFQARLALYECLQEAHRVTERISVVYGPGLPAPLYADAVDLPRLSILRVLEPDAQREARLQEQFKAAQVDRQIGTLATPPGETIPDVIVLRREELLAWPESALLAEHLILWSANPHRKSAERLASLGYRHLGDQAHYSHYQRQCLSQAQTKSTALPGEAAYDPLALARRHGIAVRGVIHVGAHLGEEVETYRRAGVERMLLVEANPEVFRQLQQRVAGVPGITLAQVAISDQNGEVSLNVTSMDQSSSILPLHRHLEVYPSIQATHVVPVPARTLDTLLAELGLRSEDYNYLHLDIQGAELMALRGAAQTLHSIEVVNTEVNFEELYRGCALIEELERHLGGAGFHRAALDRPHHPSWGDALYLKRPLVTMRTLGINGRFANQLFQYLFIHTVARAHGAVLQTPDWVGRQLFGLNDPLLTSSPKDLSPDAIKQPELIWQPETRLAPATSFFGWFQIHTRHYAPRKEEIRQLFRPNAELAATFARLQTRLRPSGLPLVAIHVRRGDFGRGYFFRAPVRWYRDWLGALQSRIGRFSLYVCTDEPATVLPHLADWEPRHARLFPEFPTDLAYFLDFLVLAHADHVAISNSSFSFIATMLNPGLGECVRPTLETRALEPYDPWDAPVLNLRELGPGEQAALDALDCQ